MCCASHSATPGLTAYCYRTVTPPRPNRRAGRAASPFPSRDPSSRRASWRSCPTADQRDRLRLPTSRLRVPRMPLRPVAHSLFPSRPLHECASSCLLNVCVRSRRRSGQARTRGIVAGQSPFSDWSRTEMRWQREGNVKNNARSPHKQLPLLAKRMHSIVTPEKKNSRSLRCASLFCTRRRSMGSVMRDQSSSWLAPDADPAAPACRSFEDMTLVGRIDRLAAARDASQLSLNDVLVGSSTSQG